MAQKSSTRRHRTTDETRRHFRNSAESAQRTYEQATQAGQRIQEQAGAWWSKVMTNSEWQKQVINFSEIATETIPLAQRNVEQLMKLVDKSCRSGVDVMKKAVEVMPAQGNGEMQSAWMELWISGSRAAQANSHAVMELGTTAIDSWTQFVRKVAKAAPEPHLPGA